MPITWEKREEATSIQEAIEALGDFLSSSHGIMLLLHKTNSDGPRKTLLAVKAYAEKWKVPFSLSLLRTMVAQTDRKRWNGESDEPAPRRDDFKSSNAFYRALDTWRDNCGNHHWVSSSETSNC